MQFNLRLNSEEDLMLHPSTFLCIFIPSLNCGIISCSFRSKTFLILCAFLQLLADCDGGKIKHVLCSDLKKTLALCCFIYVIYMIKSLMFFVCTADFALQFSRSSLGGAITPNQPSRKRGYWLLILNISIVLNVRERKNKQRSEC